MTDESGSSESGTVVVLHLLNFAKGFGRQKDESGFDPLLDLNGDGIVNFSDFLSFVAVFGQ